MKTLRKTKANVVQAQLYATERKTVYEDGPNWAVCIDTYRPLTDDCKHAFLELGQPGGRYYTEADINRNIATGKRDFGNWGFCSFDFIYRGENYGSYLTDYHLEGKCQNH